MYGYVEDYLKNFNMADNLAEIIREKINNGIELANKFTEEQISCIIKGHCDVTDIPDNQYEFIDPFIEAGIVVHTGEELIVRDYYSLFKNLRLGISQYLLRKITFWTLGTLPEYEDIDLEALEFFCSGKDPKRYVLPLGRNMTYGSTVNYKPIAEKLSFRQLNPWYDVDSTLEKLGYNYSRFNRLILETIDDEYTFSLLTANDADAHTIRYMCTKFDVKCEYLKEAQFEHDGDDFVILKNYRGFEHLLS